MALLGAMRWCILRSENSIFALIKTRGHEDALELTVHDLRAIVRAQVESSTKSFQDLTAALRHNCYHCTDILKVSYCHSGKREVHLTRHHLDSNRQTERNI
jgi:hypothetical protein